MFSSNLKSIWQKDIRLKTEFWLVAIISVLRIWFSSHLSGYHRLLEQVWPFIDKERPSCKPSLKSMCFQISCFCSTSFVYLDHYVSYTSSLSAFKVTCCNLWQEYSHQLSNLNQVPLILFLCFLTESLRMLCNIWHGFNDLRWALLPITWFLARIPNSL